MNLVTLKQKWQAEDDCDRCSGWRHLSNQCQDCGKVFSHEEDMVEEGNGEFA